MYKKSIFCYTVLFTPLNILNGTPSGVPLDVSRATLPINQLKSTVIKDDRSNSNVRRCIIFVYFIGKGIFSPVFRDSNK